MGLGHRSYLVDSEISIVTSIEDRLLSPSLGCAWAVIADWKSVWARRAPTNLDSERSQVVFCYQNLPTQTRMAQPRAPKYERGAKVLVLTMMATPRDPEFKRGARFRRGQKDDTP